MLWRMTVPVTVLRTHLHYTTWASARIVEAAAALSPEELTRDHKSADKSVLGTLAHIYAADRMWLGRIQGAPPAVFFDPAVDMQWPVVQHEWPALLARWQAWGDALQDASVAVAYHDLKGNPYSTPLWQIVLHVVNHGTHHRGQVSAMIRAMGHTPPPLDLIRYYREVGG
jgi:uncharacterized damage-inducible protein DinB